MPGTMDTSSSRTVRLERRRNAPFGFSVRGGREHGTGLFVSHIEPGSSAQCHGLKVGDQIVRVNGFAVEEAVHREALQLIQTQRRLKLKVKTTGMIPIKEKCDDPLSWRIITEGYDRNGEPGGSGVSNGMQHLHHGHTQCSPVPTTQFKNGASEVMLYLDVPPRAKLGCGICKGPEWRGGVFVQFTKDQGLARRAGLRPGDQLVRCNGVTLDAIPFNEAVSLLKSSRQLELAVLPGVGADLFPGESSGYNSSASSVAGDQSPTGWSPTTTPASGYTSTGHGTSVTISPRPPEPSPIFYNPECCFQLSNTPLNTKVINSHPPPPPRLSIVAEESDESCRIWTSKESSSPAITKHSCCTVIRIGDDETQVANPPPPPPPLETVIVEVHRSETEPDTEPSNADSSNEGSKCSVLSLASSTTSSSFSSAISQELTRRNKRRESCELADEVENQQEQRKDMLLKSLNQEKRHQHDQLMAEFKKAHKKMFSASEEDDIKSSKMDRKPIDHDDRKSNDDVDSSVVLKRNSLLKEKSPPAPPPMPKSMENSDNEIPDCPTPDYDSTPPNSGRNSLAYPKSNGTSSKVFPGKTIVNFQSNSEDGSKKGITYTLMNGNSTIISKTQLIGSETQPKVKTNAQTKILPSATASLANKSNGNNNSNNINNSTTNTNGTTKVNGISSETITKTINAFKTKTVIIESKSNSASGDAVEMRSLESFKLKNPTSTEPRPPNTYFQPPRSNVNTKNNENKCNQNTNSQNGHQKKQETYVGVSKKPGVAVTIGAYPTSGSSRPPSRFDFLPNGLKSSGKASSGSSTSAVNGGLQSELASTLSRANLKAKIETKDNVVASSPTNRPIHVAGKGPAPMPIDIKPLQPPQVDFREVKQIAERIQAKTSNGSAFLKPNNSSNVLFTINNTGPAKPNGILKHHGNSNGNPTSPTKPKSITFGEKT